MKRSEALKIISDELHNVVQVTGMFSDSFPQTTAKEILAKLEKAGMKPPAVETKETVNIPTSDGPATSHEMTFTKYEWEKE